MKQLQTGCLGGVKNVTVDDLQAMQDGDYILHARDRLLTKVPVEKSRLPFDHFFHPQGGEIFRASDQLIYVKQATILSKSTDGGRTWTSWNIERREEIDDKWQVLNDGTFIRVSMTVGEGAKDPAKVYWSRDEGRTWEQVTEIPIEVPGGYKTRYAHWRMTKLPDDTLFFCLDLRDDEYGGDRFLSAETVLTAYRSTNRGKIWEGPIKVCEWVAEGGIAQLPSGRLLASVRYQRPLLPTDSPRAPIGVSGDERGFKHHFLIDSDDGGWTWKNLRPLTTVYGQCYGYPAAQSDGTVVVIHDTRYGPGSDAARAMISRDEGKTWEDEVYYVFFGEGGTGYSESVVLDDDTILTVGGTSTHPDAKRYWHASIGYSHLTAIRWKPVKRECEALRKIGAGSVEQKPIQVENSKQSRQQALAGGVTLWKKEHPEFLVDSAEVPKDKDSHPLGLYVIAQDFTHQEVRDRKFEIIEEICRRYDIDGVNLNYIRHR